MLLFAYAYFVRLWVVLPVFVSTCCSKILTGMSWASFTRKAARNSKSMGQSSFKHWRFRCWFHCWFPARKVSSRFTAFANHQWWALYWWWHQNGWGHRSEDNWPRVGAGASHRLGKAWWCWRKDQIPCCRGIPAPSATSCFGIAMPQSWSMSRNADILGLSEDGRAAAY